MKFRIHYEIKGVADYVDIEEDTLQECQVKGEAVLKNRGLDVVLNQVWSEELK